MVTTFLTLLWVGLLPRLDNASRVEAAAQDLRSPAVETRILALRRLVKLPADKTALEPLVSALTDSDSAVRLEAVKTWGIVGKSYDLAEIALLRHQARGTADPDIWQQEHYKAWITKLIGTLDQNTRISTPAVGHEALRTIALLDVSMQQLLTFEDAPADADNQCLEPADKCLTDISKDHFAVVAELLQDKNPNVVYSAVVSLRDANPKNDRMVQPVLWRFLADRRPEWRAIAIDQLEDLQAVAYVKRLLPLLGDDDERVRELAIRNLDHIDDDIVQKAIAPLVAAFAGSNVSLRRSIIELDRDHSEHWERAALLDEDGEVRAEAIETLAEHTNKIPLAYIAQQLAHPAPHVRAAAMKAIANHEDKPSLQNLLPFLNDPDTDVRDAAIETIFGLHNPRPIEPLLNALLHSADKDEAMSDVVVEGLAGSGETVAPLIRQMLTNTSARLRLVAVRTAIRLLPESASDILAAALNDSDSQVRLSILSALRERNNKNAESLLLPMLRDSDKEVRVKAIELLGVMRVVAAQEPLKALLKNDKEDDDIYYAAWYALKRMNRPEVPHNRM